MPISHKQAVQAALQSANTTIAVAITPNAAGNIIIVAGGANATAPTITIADSPGAHTWIECNPVKAQAGSGSMRGFYAIAKNTSATTITITSSTTPSFMNVLGNEFDGVDQVSPIGAHDEASGATGSPISAAMVLDVDDEAVWAACNDSITAVGNIDGSAATKGADDLQQDWTEWRVLVGRNGASITAAFTGTSGAWIQLSSVLRPAVVIPLLVRESHAQFPKPLMQRI